MLDNKHNILHLLWGGLIEEVNEIQEDDQIEILNKEEYALVKKEEVIKAEMPLGIFPNKSERS